MNLRAARAEWGAVQPKGHVSFSDAGRGWNVRWRATSHAQNPVKSPRHDFSTFLATVNLAAAEVVIDSSVVLLRDTVRCHSRLGVLGGLNLYPPVLM